MTGYKIDLWFGIAPISAGIFGMPAGMLTLIVVSLLTAAPSRSVQEMVENVRYPVLGNEVKQGT
jgi:cation/acetate symporter